MHNTQGKMTSFLLMIILWAASTIVNHDAYSASTDLPDGSQLSLNIISMVLKSNNRWDISGNASFVKNSDDPRAMATEIVYTIKGGPEIPVDPDTMELPWTVTTQDTWIIIDLQANAGDQFCAIIKGVAANGSGSVSECSNLNDQVQQGDFSISCNPNSISVSQGSSADCTVTISSINGFNSSVNLACVNVPQGASCNFSNSSVTPPANGNAQSTLTVTAQSVAPGSYNFILRGSHGNQVHDFPIALEVKAQATAFSFNISVSPASQSIRQGESATYDITVTHVSGLPQNVKLNVYGLPQGTSSFSFSQASGVPTFTSILKVAGNQAGTYQLTIEGAGGGVVMTYSITLQIVAQQTPAEPPIDYSSVDATIRLDSKKYSPYGRVHITLIAPSLNISPRSDIARVDITLLPSNLMLEGYRLVENEPNSGTFMGKIELQGSVGIASGTGPNDGTLPAKRGDQISIKFGNKEETVPIDYSKGEIVWDRPSYNVGDKAVVTLIDPDLDRLHHMKESAKLKLYNGSELVGQIELMETDTDSGQFSGILVFKEKGSALLENEVWLEEDNTFVSYDDNTMPLPSRIIDERNGFTEVSEIFSKVPMDNLQKEPVLKRTFVLGEILLTLRDGIDPSSDRVQEEVKKVNGKIIQVVREINLVKISVPEGMEQKAIDELQKSGIAKFAGKNKYIVLASASDIRDPDFAKQSKHYEMINLPAAWSISMGRKDVVVAVLDSGIDLNHMDLKDNIWVNDNDDCNDGVDNDSNGFIDDCNGWNFALSNNNVMDDSGSWPRCDGHGTHVSGIIAASSNAIGGLGVAPNISVMPVKVSAHEDIEGDVVCVSDEGKVSQAVIYATKNGAMIINASLGCPNGEKCIMPALGQAFKFAFDNGVLVVLAAGNERETSEGIDDWQEYSDYILEVSSVDLSGELARYSNFGSGVKLSAPGTTVYSTKIDDRYGIKTGTSQAAPMVAGCAALLLSANESLTNTDLERILKESAKDIGEKGRDDFFGYGLLDCEKALKSRIITLQEEGSVSVAMKHKKKVSLVSVKKSDSRPLSYFEISIMDGNIKFVKARNWDRGRIDQSTVIVFGDDKPIKDGSSLIIIMVVDNKESSYQWKAYGENKSLIASGKVSPR